MNEGKNILTYGLGGCTATVIYIGLKNGTKKVILTHFPPNNILGNLEEIRSLAGNIDKNEIKEVNCLYISPNIQGNDKKQNDTFLEGLQTQVKVLFGEKYNGEVKKYSIFPELYQKDFGTLSVELDENGVYYRHLSNGFGKLDGIAEKEEEENRIEEIKISLA